MASHRKLLSGYYDDGDVKIDIKFELRPGMPRFSQSLRGPSS